MKVRELIAQLQALDPNLDVLCYEEGPIPIQAGPGPFDVVAASVANAERSRTSNGRPTLAFDNEKGRPIAILGITPDF